MCRPGVRSGSRQVPEVLGGLVRCRPGVRFKQGSGGSGWSGAGQVAGSSKVPELSGWSGAGQVTFLAGGVVWAGARFKKVPQVPGWSGTGSGWSGVRFKEGSGGSGVGRRRRAACGNLADGVREMDH